MDEEEIVEYNGQRYRLVADESDRDVEACRRCALFDECTDHLIEDDNNLVLCVDMKHTKGPKHFEFMFNPKKKEPME